MNSIIKFFILLLDTDFNNIDSLLMLKDIAYNYWEQGNLTDSEHCDIEALLDEHLSKF